MLNDVFKCVKTTFYSISLNNNTFTQFFFCPITIAYLLTYLLTLHKMYSFYAFTEMYLYFMLLWLFAQKQFHVSELFLLTLYQKFFTFKQTDIDSVNIKDMPRCALLLLICRFQSKLNSKVCMILDTFRQENVLKLKKLCIFFVCLFRR